MPTEILGLWQHILAEMNNIQGMEVAFNMRRRLNPHHPDTDVKEETRKFRSEQFARWMAVKAVYIENRDQLVDTMDNEDFARCKSIMERILTQEVDDALRKAFDSIPDDNINDD